MNAQKALRAFALAAALAIGTAGHATFDELLTTHPSADYSPAAAPDGSSLVFVSERGGAPGLYVRGLEGPQTRPPRPLHAHPANTFSPTVSPDGRHLAFVSERVDALGDIFLGRFPDGSISRITPTGQTATNPRFSRDSRTLYFQMGRAGAPLRWHAYNIRSGETSPVEGGPPETVPSPPYQARHLDPVRGVALLYSDDTTGDGTRGPGDGLTAWIYNGERWQQATLPLPGARDATATLDHGTLYVSARWTGNLDIGAIHSTPLLEARTHEDYADLAREALARPRPDLELASAAWREAMRTAPGNEARAEAGREHLVLLNRLGRHGQTVEKGGQLLDMQDISGGLRDRLRAHFLVARAEHTRRQQDERRETAAPLIDDTAELRQLRERFLEREEYREAGEIYLQLARLMQLDQDYTGALAETEPLVEDLADRMPPDVVTRAVLHRVDIYTALGLGQETERTLFSIFELGVADRDAQEQAAERLLTLLDERHAEAERRLIEVRSFVARAADHPFLLARLLLREGQLLQDLAEPRQAEEVYTEAAGLIREAPRPAAEAVSQLARLQAGRGAFRDAVDTFQTARDRLEDADEGEALAIFQGVRRQLIRSYLEKGRSELRLGDPLRAAATYRELLRLDETLPQAWRGLYAALSNEDWAIREARRNARDATRENPGDPIAWYRYGLARSYEEPTSGWARDALERAISLDSASPYPYLTKGFIDEQRFRRDEERGRIRNELLEEAALAYEQALALSDPEEDPQLQADALLNLGNVALALNQNFRANSLYINRERTPVAFGDPRTEFLFYLNSGIAAFRASDPARARTVFERAEGLLDELVDNEMIVPDRGDALRLELTGRRALALMDMGARPEARALFQRVYTASPEQSLARVRALRNQALLLELEARQAPPEEREATLLNGLAMAERALTEIQDPNLTGDPDMTTGAGLINIDFVFSSDPVAGAGRLAFDRRDEEQLLRSTRARLLQLLGESQEAIPDLQRRLELDPRITDLNRAYYYASRSVTLSQLAGRQAETGQRGDALDNVLDALVLTRFRVSRDEFANATAAASLLAQAQELLLAWSEPPNRADHTGFWMMSSEDRNAAAWPWEFMDRAAQRLTEAHDPAFPGEQIPLLTEDADLARLRFVRATAAERLAAEQLYAIAGSPGTPSDEQLRNLDVYTRDAEEHAAELLALAQAAADPEVPRRLALLAQAIPARLALLRGDAETAEDHLAQAREFAAHAGFHGHRWWLAATAALASSREEDRARYAATAAQEFLNEPLSPAGLSWAGVEPLFAALEEAELTHAHRIDEPETAWDAVDRWRAVRLRVLNHEASASALTGGHGQWLHRFAQHRNALVAAAEELRRTPSTSTVRHRQARETLDNRRTAFESHIREGRDRDLPAAGYAWAGTVPFAQLAMLLDPPFLGETPPAFALNRTVNGSTFRAIYTPEESRFLPEDTVEVPAGHRVYTIGEPLPATISIVDGGTILRNAERLSLRTGREPVRLTGALPPDARQLRLAETIEVEVPLQRRGKSPGTWTIGEGGRTLAELLRAAPDLEQLVFIHPAPDGPTGYTDLRLASWLAAHGVVQTTFRGQAWIGHPLDPREAPFLAEEQLLAAEDALFQALDEERIADSAVKLERVILLKESIGDPDELDLYYGKLAELKGALGRWGEALEAARRRVALLEEAATGGSVELAGAKRTAAQIASRARQWDEAEELYAASMSIYQDAGNEEGARAVSVDRSILLENSGRYQEALSLGEEIAAAAREAGDARLETEQRLRRARVLRIYLNRYLAAGEELRTALARAEEHDLEGLRIDAMLNIVRVKYALARFDEAEALAQETLELARQADDRSRVGQAYLEIANVEWLRSEYFASFREQQEAIGHAQAAQDGPLEVAIRNVSGLTSWAVNDLERAFAELEAALDLAIRIGVEGEIATTSNNLGLLYRSQERWEDALTWFGRALEIDEAEGNRWGQAYSLRNIGITHTLAGDAPQALEPLREALALSTEIGDETNAAKAVLALGDALLELGELTEAQESFEIALEDARRLPLPEVEWRALYGKARIAVEQDDTTLALSHLDEAIDTVDGLRASIRIEEFQDGFLLDKQDLYDMAIDLRLDRGEAAAALETSERSRGRNFIDLLGNRSLELGSPADQERFERERSLRARLEELQTARREATGDDAEELDAQIAQARQEYSDYLLLLRTESPELSSFLRVEPVTISELQEYIDPGTRMLVYHLLPDRAVAWVLGPDSLEVAELPGRTEDLVEAIERTRRRLQNFERVEEDLAFLSRRLLEPVLPALEDAQRIGIVPHRQLHTLPFAPLPVAGGPHLIDRAALYYVPSASVLRYTLPRRDREDPVEGVLAVGNPDLGNPAYDLPFAQKEVERLRFDFPHVEFRTGAEATDRWLVENLPNYGIIHIASHGEYLPDAPLFSAVYLAPDEETDGVLTAQRIFSLQMRADLVALSACQTGLGRVSAGDDVVGLNRAFTYAGTRQLLTTLWRVDDISTAILFKYFYRNHAEHDRAQALRLAQIQLKERPEYRHPAHWAGIVLSGDWQ